MNLSKVLPYFLICSVLSGCVIKFANSERRVGASFRKIHVPTAVDISTHGGNAGRVSHAVRRRIAQDTRFELSNAEDARWALDLEIKSRSNIVESTVACLPVDAQGPGATGFTQSITCSDTERTRLMLTARAVDLNSGKVLFERPYDLVSEVHDNVGEADVKQGLARTPQLHALRYLENVDAAVETLSTSVADDILVSLSRLNP